MGHRYRRFFRGTVTADQLAQLRDTLNAYGLDAVIDPKGMLISFGIPLYFGIGHPQQHVAKKPKPKNIGEDETEVVVPPVVYFIETGRVPTLDAAIDTLFASWLEQDPTAQAYCSHCYAHFTPVVKQYEVQASMSCTISLPRNSPVLADQFALDTEEYLDLYGVPVTSYYRTTIVLQDPYEFPEPRREMP